MAIVNTQKKKGIIKKVIDSYRSGIARSSYVSKPSNFTKRKEEIGRSFTAGATDIIGSGLRAKEEGDALTRSTIGQADDLIEKIRNRASKKRKIDTSDPLYRKLKTTDYSKWK